MQSTAFSSVGTRADQAGPGQGSDALRQLLLGSGEGKMNLQSVKERGLALRKSIDEFIEMLRHQPHLLTWATSLERFGVMSLRHQQLVEQLSPLLRFYVAHPKAVNQANAEIIPLLLSTMKLPEMEAEEQDLLRNHTRKSASKAPAVMYEESGVEIDSFNGLLRELVQHSPDQDGSGILDPKGPRLRHLSQDLRQAVNNAESVSEVKADDSEGANELLAAALTGEGLM